MSAARPTPIRPTTTMTPGTTFYVVTADDLRQVAFDAAQAALAAVLPETPGIAPDRALTQTELARLLACSTEHVRQLEKRGELDATWDGRRKLYGPATIAALFQRRLDGAR